MCVVTHNFRDNVLNDLQCNNQWRQSIIGTAAEVTVEAQGRIQFRHSATWMWRTDGRTMARGWWDLDVIATWTIYRNAKYTSRPALITVKIRKLLLLQWKAAIFTIASITRFSRRQDMLWSYRHNSVNASRVAVVRPDSNDVATEMNRPFGRRTERAHSGDGGRHEPLLSTERDDDVFTLYNDDLAVLSVCLRA